MKFEFNNLEEPAYSYDFFYDLTIGGYINPNEMLDDEDQIKQLEIAVQLVNDFFDTSRK